VHRTSGGAAAGGRADWQTAIQAYRVLYRQTGRLVDTGETWELRPSIKRHHTTTIIPIRMLNQPSDEWVKRHDYFRSWALLSGGGKGKSIIIISPILE